MRVNEIYHAVQGEGPFSGTPCVFVRLHFCPVHCRWCDTAFTWDGSEVGRELSIDEILHEIGDARHVVVTGGEPLAQVKELRNLLSALVGRQIEIETAAILVAPDWAIAMSHVRWNVSPKLPSAGARIAPDLTILVGYRNLDSVLKLVIADDVDFAAALALAQGLDWPPGRLWLMPEGRDQATLSSRLAWLLDQVTARRLACRVSTRMHIHAYGARRGV